VNTCLSPEIKEQAMTTTLNSEKGRVLDGLGAAFAIARFGEQLLDLS
jgi:hypothetical protein